MKMISCRIFLVCLVTIVTSCTPNVYRMKEAPYTPLESVSEYETVIYVFREKLDVWRSLVMNVGCNDKIVGSLKSGTFCRFPVKADEDQLITISSSKFLFNGMSINCPLGKPCYLFFTFRNKKSYLTKLSAERAEELQQEYAYTVIERKGEPNPVYRDWHDIILVNPDISADLNIMKETHKRMAPDADHAVVTFLRASRVFHNVKAGIWSENDFLGSLRGGSCFQVKVPEGKYVFVGRMEHWSFLKSELEAGKEYFVIVTVTMGWKAPHVRLIPLGSTVKEEDLETLKTQAGTFLELNEEVVDEKMKKHFKKTLPMIETAIDEMEAGRLASRVLQKSDGR